MNKCKFGFSQTLRIFIPFPRRGGEREAPLNAFIIVRERNASQASKLERDSQ